MRTVKQWIATLVALLIVLSFSWAFFSSDFFRVHDYTHVARIVEMHRSLTAGHIPVHWTQNFGYGYGMPLFLFYGPLPFYSAVFFMLFGASALLSMKLVFFLTGVIAFWGMYLLGRRYSHTAGLVAAVLFFTAPYRAVDIFVRGAINETWAIGFLPWLVYGGMEMRKHPRRGLIITSFSTAAIILSHNLTAFFAIPLLGIFVVGWQWIENKPAWKENLRFIGAGVLGALMSLFYIVPAFLEKQYTIIDSILSGYFDYHHHFLYIRQLIRPNWGYGGSGFGPDDGISFHLGTMALILIGLGGLFILRSFFSSPGKKKRTLWQRLQQISAKQQVFILSGILLAVSLFMTLGHAEPIWDTVPLLNYIQFPWRFLAVAIVFSSLMGGIAVSQLQVAPLRWFISWTFILLVVLSTWNFHRPESFLQRAEDFYYTDPQTIRTNMSDILPDYIPAEFNRELPPVSENERIALDTVEVTQLELSRPHQVLWLGTAPEGSTITWNIADFPGWRYYVNDQEVEPILTKDGLRQITLSEPIESVGAEFTMTPVRQYAAVISAVAWIFWLTLALPWKKPKEATHVSL